MMMYKTDNLSDILTILKELEPVVAKSMKPVCKNAEVTKPEVSMEKDCINDKFAPVKFWIKDCIIDEKSGKVILKTIHDEVFISQVAEGDTFNPEVGILWALAKVLFDAIEEDDSVLSVVNYCKKLSDAHKTRAVARKNAQREKAKGASMTKKPEENLDKQKEEFKKALNDYLRNMLTNGK